MNENQREKLQDFTQYRHKILQILKNLIFSSFASRQKKQKIKASLLGDSLTARRLTELMSRFA
ncbi:MAG: hypothetical protein LBK94_06410 [Prevotellaceae bacterium]|jgi:aromatic ring hydroxylase|nr:hypothetical protein [Prevotellaceae bacterium]